MGAAVFNSSKNKIPSLILPSGKNEAGAQIAV
jgi:hypothetical protein